MIANYLLLHWRSASWLYPACLLLALNILSKSMGTFSTAQTLILNTQCCFCCNIVCVANSAFVPVLSEQNLKRWPETLTQKTVIVHACKQPTHMYACVCVRACVRVLFQAYRFPFLPLLHSGPRQVQKINTQPKCSKFNDERRMNMCPIDIQLTWQFSKSWHLRCLFYIFTFSKHQRSNTFAFGPWNVCLWHWCLCVQKNNRKNISCL